LNSITNLTLSPDTSIDLQLHTIYSDGKWTPEGLIDYLVSEGFGLAAITDHDRPDIVGMLQTLAAERRLPLLAAVEMTCSWRGDMTDILCYDFDPDDNHLLALARDILRRQQENTVLVYENLRKEGITFPDHPIELTALLALPAAQQPHSLVALLKEHGYGTPEKSAGKWVLEAGFEFQTHDIGAVVDAAHRSGAVALIAHPGRSDGFVQYDVDLLDQFRAEAPIDGLEAYYPLHSPEQTEMFLAYAQKHDLLTSSGSDSHSAEKQLPIKYPAELSRDLLERVGIRVL
jgi:3',5'-nucleoside bisphosphate phosphatase